MFSFRSLARISLFGLPLLVNSIGHSSLLHEQLVVHGSVNKVPQTFIKAGKPNSDQEITLTIGLVSPNMSRLEKKLYEISDHNHTDYGKYLTKQEVEAFVHPLTNVTTALATWLSHYNISSKNTTSAGNRLSVTMSVTQAEQLFNTSLEVYNHTLSKQSVIRATQYSVPKALVNDIKFVHPITSFSPGLNTRPRRTKSKTVSPSNTTKIIRRDSNGCDPQSVTLNCAMNLYHIPTNIGVPSTTEEIVILSFIGQSAQGVDVIDFIKEFRADVPPNQIRLEIKSVDGGDNPQGVSQGDAIEADLDVQMVAGIAPNSRITVIAAANSDDLEAFGFLLNQDSMATVVSMSYGIDEPTDAGNINVSTSICEDIMQLTARGTTVVVASGDGGVSGATSTDCTAFQPDFPASCPFVLSVGATQLSSNNVETAASFSGGGFSNLFQMPSYQTEAVKSYLNQIGPLNSGLYNPGGRAYPDISAIGTSMQMVDDGLLLVDGTSISAPVVAGILAAVNDRRHADGKNPVGFIHPWIYANAAAITDITQGSNPGCNTNGFPAMKGWDPVTGMGTLLFDNLLAMP